MRVAWKVGLISLIGLTVACLAGYWLLRDSPFWPFDEGSETIEVTDYGRPAPVVDDTLADDRLEGKSPAFDPARVDRRPLGEWRINTSSAVVRLDTPMLLPDRDAGLLELHPSYRSAVEVAGKAGPGTTVLPSINMIDGKAKQVDDGLYAALDLAYYRGLEGVLVGHVALVRRMLEKVGPASPAAPYLAAGLAIAGEAAPVTDEASKARWISAFKADAVRSTPIAFYAWNKALSDCFRFLRYFQGPLPRGSEPIAAAIADALKGDPTLLADYRKALAFYARLTNPSRDPSFADLAEGKARPDWSASPSLFPAATSRETELFEKLFPVGLPWDADLMRTLIAKIRSGSVRLAPGPSSGWYDYQVFALETMLLPGRGEESSKLLLTRAYKERMLEAFKALMTKRRETHARGLKTAAGGMEMPSQIAPRLRLEPCPTYYLRTARAYAFLADFLESAVGLPALERLHGLREGGERPLSLRDELRSARDLFYGFYLLSAEDIGLATALLDGEPVDRDRSEEAARSWLANPLDDPDLAVDTRVSVPIYLDPGERSTRLWATLGVRVARLDAEYVRAPRLRPASGEGAWREPEAYKLGKAPYLIAVDEFAEVRLQGLRSLTRGELRLICDREKTKEAIVAALRSPGGGPGREP